MAVEHAYVTFVADRERATGASVGTINLEALADQNLANLLASEDFAGVTNWLRQLPGEHGEPELQVMPVEFPDGFNAESEAFQYQVASVLSATNVEEAESAWYLGHEASDANLGLAVGLLESTVLAEYSDAAARKAAGAVGAACATGAGAVMAAVISTGAVGAAGGAGVALLIAGPIGIVVIGVGAAALTLRLFTRRNA
ncbi:hypothetical protein ABIA30_000561 [Mycobacterium sp. MAA66]|uniref:hypothetical protein n=1 Tax=Mycobacterium sp. MAA66 TaxID=3156297 RepID=UPI003513525F